MKTKNNKEPIKKTCKKCGYEVVGLTEKQAQRYLNLHVCKDSGDRK